MKNLDEFPQEEQDEMERQVLARMAERSQSAPLTITEIRKMTPAQVTARKDEVDRFMQSWDGSQPESAEGEAPPEPTPLEKYRAELAALPPAERARRANADFESGKFAEIARGAV